MTQSRIDIAKKLYSEGKYIKEIADVLGATRRGVSVNKKLVANLAIAAFLVAVTIFVGTVVDHANGSAPWGMGITVRFDFIALVLVAYAILGTIATLIANVAERKGRSWTVFFIFSLFFPLIALIIAAVISTDPATATVGTKKCPKCAEYVKSEASVCKHCGSSI